MFFVHLRMDVIKVFVDSIFKSVTLLFCAWPCTNLFGHIPDKGKSAAKRRPVYNMLCTALSKLEGLFKGKAPGLLSSREDGRVAGAIVKIQTGPEIFPCGGSYAVAENATLRK